MYLIIYRYIQLIGSLSEAFQADNLLVMDVITE